MRQTGAKRRQVLTWGGIAGVVGLAGCLRLTDPSGQQATGSDTATATRTATAAGTTAEQSTTANQQTTSDGNVEYPAGVSEDGVSGSAVLGHRQLLADASYTVETTYMFQERTAKVGDAGLLVTSDRGQDAFVADGEMYQRFAVEGKTFYDYRTDVLRGFDEEALNGVGVIDALVRGCNFRPVGTRTRNGETSILIEADSITDQQAIQESENVNRYFRDSDFPLQLEAGRGIVTQDGLIRLLNVLLQGNSDGGEFTVRTTGVGTTDVSRPEWTETARQREPRFEAELVDDGAYIRVEQVAGQTIDFEIGIDAFDRREYFNGNYTGSIAAGDVLFLYKTDEETEFDSRVLGISKGSRPDSEPVDTWSSEAGWNLRVGPLQIVEGRRVG